LLTVLRSLLLLTVLQSLLLNGGMAHPALQKTRTFVACTSASMLLACQQGKHVISMSHVTCY
jgi:hypothetical protein